MVKKNNDPMIGLGGGPTRATSLPTDSAGRKEHPVASGFMDYFPDAIVAVSRLSYLATKQHHPDKPMHWNRAVSNDEADTMMRHFLQRGTIDTDGQRHSAKMAWRALAILQKEIEEEQKPEPPNNVVEIKSGPYCWRCDFPADLQSPVTEAYWCRDCAAEKGLDTNGYYQLDRA